MIQLAFPPPPDTPELPPPSAADTFIGCLVLILLAVELVVEILPENWQQKVNQLRFGPRWKS